MVIFKGNHISSRNNVMLICQFCEVRHAHISAVFLRSFMIATNLVHWNRHSTELNCPLATIVYICDAMYVW